MISSLVMIGTALCLSSVALSVLAGVQFARR